MTKRMIMTTAASSEAFAGLSDHARLPSRFHARLSATASRLRG